MSVDHVTLGADGRIVIPAFARRELGLQAGDTLVLESDGTSLLLRSVETVLQETQAYFQQFTKQGVSEVDALISERRAEAAQEDVETQAWLATTRCD